MSTIPFSQVVNVVPSVLSAGGIAVDLNGLMLTQNAYAPAGTILTFASAADVQTYFGAGSTEASLATIYFNGYSIGTKLPGELLIANYAETATAGWLRSGSLASMTLGQLQALGTGTLSVTVAGTLKTSGSISLAAVASFSAAAAAIQAAFTSPGFTVTYDSVKSAFIFTTTTTGVTQTMSFAGGTLATGLMLTSATGAVVSNGQDAAVPATFMTSIINQNQNWATFFTAWELATIYEKEAFATWSNSVAPRYLFICQDSDVNILNAASTNTFGDWLQTNQIVGTLPIYGNNTHAAFASGFAAS